MKHLDVDTLKQKMDQREDLVLLDVREDYEREICKLSPDVHIPMGDIPDRWSELPQDKDIIVYCRSGGRSLNVCQFLEKSGFSSVYNLTGGILAWADRIDPSFRKY